MTTNLETKFRLICDVVAKRHMVSKRKMLSRTNLQKFAWPRMAAIALCYRETSATLKDVCEFFGRHRWCVGNSINRMLTSYPSEIAQFKADEAAVQNALRIEAGEEK